jgi:hypothetical protein
MFWVEIGLSSFLWQSGSEPDIPYNTACRCTVDTWAYYYQEKRTNQVLTTELGYVYIRIYIYKLCCLGSRRRPGWTSSPSSRSRSSPASITATGQLTRHNNSYSSANWPLTTAIGQLTRLNNSYSSAHPRQPQQQVNSPVSTIATDQLTRLHNT